MYDTVKLGEIILTEQPLATADTIKVPLLADVVWDGVLGLAYPNKDLYDEGVIPVFDTMIERKLLDHNIISYYVNCEKGGVITFGGIDVSLLEQFDGDQAPTFLELESNAQKSKSHAVQQKSGVDALLAKVDISAKVDTTAKTKAHHHVASSTAVHSSTGSATSTASHASTAIDHAHKTATGSHAATAVDTATAVDAHAHKAAHMNTNFKYATVTDKGYWTIEIMDVEVEYSGELAVSTGVCKDQSNGRCKAIVDTGTYLTYIPGVYE